MYKIKAPTHCPLRSGRWPLCSPSSLPGWPARAARGQHGREASPSGWSETCCVPPTGTLGRWRCSLRCPLLAWSSGSRGIRCRCGSGWGCIPAAPTEGPAAAAGSLSLWDLARHAWALEGTRSRNGRLNKPPLGSRLQTSNFFVMHTYLCHWDQICYLCEVSLPVLKNKIVLHLFLQVDHFLWSTWNVCDIF